MYILYLDESGTHGEASYFVLAGLAVFEREIHWFGQDLDNIQERHFPEEQAPVFFHAARLNVRHGEEVAAPWNKLTPKERLDIKREVYNIIRRRYAVLFGCAIEYSVRIPGRDAYESAYARAFEDLAKRFDLFLDRVNYRAREEGKEEQRGLIVVADSRYAKTIALLAQRLRRSGTRWGSLHNAADVPFFAPAADTRMLQYADFCANAIYGRYNSKLTGDFDLIAHKFDQEEGRIHGLVHLSTDSSCVCPSCLSRQVRQ